MDVPAHGDAPPRPAKRIHTASVLGTGVLAGATAVVWLQMGDGPASGGVAALYAMMIVSILLRLPLSGMRNASSLARWGVALFCLSFAIEAAARFFRWVTRAQLPDTLDSTLTIVTMVLLFASLVMMADRPGAAGDGTPD